MTWTCVACTTAYSVGAPSCPHCGSTEYVEEGMAKITVHGGASNAAEAVAVVVAAASESREFDAPVIEVPDEVVEFVDVPVAPGEPYDTWLRADLEDELEARGLSKSGNKPDLVQRLIDDDNQATGPEPTDGTVDEVQPVF